MGLTGRSFEVGSSLGISDMTRVSSVSGGVFLGSGSAFSILIANVSGNAPMWIGGSSGTNVPVSGHGMLLYGGALPLELRLNAVDDIKVVADISGQFVSWAALQK
jgi:hypothetical protein